MTPLGYGREYHRERRSMGAQKLLVAVAIVLAIAVTVGMILRGDPGPALGMSEWSDASAPPAR
jgi:hypothetical protein